MSSRPEREDGQPLGLVVPVDVVALCVGTVDAVEVTGDFAGATAVYTEQVTRAREAFLGANVGRGFDDTPWQQLDAGVHLHWALPDGLTHAAVVDGELSFPAAPNRWLVTRLALAGGEATARSWLVESDAVLASRPQGQMAVTIPVTPSVSFPDGFAYLGRWQQLDASWTPGAEQPAPSLSDLGGGPLTAVANGQVGFAAYYPACASVFGFHDALEDVRPPASSPVQLAYAVVGWYDDPALDPVQPGATAAALSEAYGWTYAGEGSPSFSTCSGLVQGIAWSADIAYLKSSPVRQPLTAEVAIGDTPADALSAYFGARDAPGRPLFEQLLDAFQLGLLDSFAQPQPNQLAGLAEQLHDSRFAGESAALVHAIAAADGAGGELPDLPRQVADDLNTLNDLEQQSAQCSAQVDWMRWQLFADWYRIFEASDDQTRNDAYLAAYHRYGAWDTLAQQCRALAGQVSQQLAVVQGELPAGTVLEQTPSERSRQPSDPAVLLVGEGVELPPRYGGDGRGDDDGLLTCRTSDQLVTAETVAGRAIAADRFAAVAAPAALPHAVLATALLREACLLDTVLVAAIASADPAALRRALAAALAGQQQTTYTFTGTPPPPVAVEWCDGDPWLPLFASWTADHLPLQPTVENGTPQTYAPQFFDANFTLDPDAGGAIAYTPTGQYGIDVDPATAHFPQRYRGDTTLSPTSAQTLARLLTDYLAAHDEATLRTILDQLGAGAFATVSLAGFSNLLQMRRETLQLEVRVPDDSDYAELTEAIQPLVGDANAAGPDFNGWFNPLRAGWLKLSLRLVDVFGQQRDVAFDQLVCAEPVTTVVGEQPVPSVAWLPPRIAQPSRLLFRWLAAGGQPQEQITTPPAVSPVCGWLVPDHLDGSLFLYDAQGRALGTLYLEQDPNADPAVGWLSAPGDQRTIGQPIETVLALVDPQLRAFGLTLKSASRAFFTALWRALDTVGGSVDPAPLASDSGLVTLVGRPVALAAAALRLEVQGRPAVDLGWDALSDDDSDAGFAAVELPVVLGDLRRLADGLVGYFKQDAGDGYDLSAFYTQGAPDGGGDGVLAPRQDTLTVTVSPQLDGSSTTRRVLMLLDPRAAVHATSGVLPTGTLQLAPSQVDDALRTLDLSFFTAPVLRGNGGLALPVPRAAGYQTAWIAQVQRGGGTRAWEVDPEIGTPAGRAVWSYTPQTVTEGWLRLNPALLTLELLDTEDKPVVVAGSTNALRLRLTNKSRRTIAFEPGTPVPEGTEPGGSIFYVRFGALVAAADVAAIAFSGSGWAFQLFQGPTGPYWAAAASAAPVALGPDATVELSVANVRVADAASDGPAYFDYYAIDGLNDGVFADSLTVAQPTATHLRP